MTLQERYSKLVDAKIRVQLQLKDEVVFNNRYEGDPKAGAVKVRKSGAATVVDYDKVNGVALTQGSSEFITITIDKDKAVNEIIDGYDAASVPDGLVADRLDSAGYGIALTVDTDGAVTLVNQGTALEDTAALTKSNIYGKVVDVRTSMNKLGVPNDGLRYLLVDPDAMGFILKSDEFTPASDLGDAAKSTGIVGRIAGFNVIESSNLGTKTVGEGASATTYKVEFIAGHPLFATRVNEWAVPVHVQDLAGSGKYIGACAVQGRKVYGHKVTNPAAILVKTTTA